MSDSYDEKVVSMRFDNQQFEKGVGQSLKTLDNLEKGLKMEGAIEGIRRVNNAAANFTLNGMTSAIEEVGYRFTMLEIAAYTTIQNITNRAINAGMRIANALTIEPVYTGLKEYETQMGAIQTILTNTAAKGTTLEDVNKALDTLNHYADKTIYNFTEMTANIGRFTAAGIGLEDATDAIQGIANLAAGSGSTSAQASMAMYQLSQALASGKVHLQDWNSVVNAGMGGELFQNALMDTAKKHGIAVDQIVKKSGSFRESLREDWLTSEILLETLRGFADENTELGKQLTAAATEVKTITQLWDTLKEAVQSGWTQTWEYIIGDFEQSKQLLTSISNAFNDAINAQAEARNKVFEQFNKYGARDRVIEGMWNLVHAIQALLKPIKEAYHTIFAITGNWALQARALNIFSVKFRDLTNALIINGDTADKIKRVFMGLFSVFDIIGQAISGLWRVISPLFVNVTKAGNSVLGFSATVGDSLTNLGKFLRENDIFFKFFSKIKDYATIAIGAIIWTVNSVKSQFKQLGSYIQPIKEKLLSIYDIIRASISNLTGFKDVAVNAFNAVSDSASSVLSNFQPITSIGGFILTIFSGILTIAQKLAPVVMSAGSVIFSIINGIKNAISKVFENLSLGNMTDTLDSLAAGGLVVVLTTVLSSLRDFIKSGSGIFDGVKDIIDGVSDTFGSLTDRINASSIKTIAVSIAILAGSLFVLSMVDSGKIETSMLVLSGLFAELFGATGIMSKYMDASSAKALQFTAKAMTNVAIACLILAGSIKVLSSIDEKSLGRGLTSMAALLAMVVASAKMLGTVDKSIKSSTKGIIGFAVGILILTKAVEKLGAMNPEQLMQGLFGVLGVVAAISLFLIASQNAKVGVSVGLGLIGVATAMLILQKAVVGFADMDFIAMQKGLLGLAEALLAITLALNFMPKHMVGIGLGLIEVAAAVLILSNALRNMGSMSLESMNVALLGFAGAMGALTLALNFMPKNMIGIGLGLIGVATALLIMSNALIKIGGMDPSSLFKSLAGLGIALTEIAIAVNFMTGAMSGAAALVVVSLALAILAPVLKLLGTMNLEQLGNALLTLATMFILFGAAAAILGPMVPALLGLAGAMALIGAGTLMAGAGILMLTTAFAGLSVSVAALTGTFTILVSAIAGILSEIAILVVTGLTEILAVLAENTPTILESINEMIIAIIDSVVSLLPRLVVLVDELIKSICNVLLKDGPIIIQTLLQLLTYLFTQISNYAPLMFEQGINLIIGFLNAISEKLPDIMNSAIDLIVSFVNGIGRNTYRVIDAIFDMVVDMINGLAKAIDDNHDAIWDAMKNLLTSIVTAIADGIGDLIECGKDIVLGVRDGIVEAAKEAVSAAVELGESIWDAILSFFGIASPSKLMAEAGMYLDQGLAVGMREYSDVASSAAEGVGEETFDALSESLSKIGDLTDYDFDLDPTITPVVDMSNVEYNSGRISSLLGGKVGISTDGLQSTAGYTSQNMLPVDTSAHVSGGIVNNYTFNQTNNSPKALSRIELYRYGRDGFGRLGALGV